MTTNASAEVKAFFDPDTFTVTYVVADISSGECAIIDSVLDYDPDSGRTGTKSADQVIAYIEENNYSLKWILETHVHADHLTAGPYLKEKLGGKTAIGNLVPIIQNTFGPVFNAGSDFATDGSQFDQLFSNDESFNIGGLTAKVLHTPGHTPACVTYVIDGACYVGDTMFMPDFGTARCDFPGGDAAELYSSIQRILSMPDDTVLYMCHDYGPGGRDYKWITSVGEQKSENIHLAGKNREEYIEARTSRDAELSMPKLILPSVQVNMRGGVFPAADNNGTSYIKIPLNKL
ncbi:MAG: MBL fold metallo-hydrolase [Kordiimonadaceae bacterium]|jgi:glyoxylase-like metal-dependent hydrolase (beta-lactamase superfamily II)|nr:MBL fold metallo-hydrolase [Kordiimonadaceae bacterium]MBT6035379.1 MBL fold metallo-hydrolase [Kordiimonadaceae bacterium]MBT6329474.1 MBL fold metallo-hydrolase [Kordiimonadaceae bacterium]MBT7581419.1 MBL fold metallo-hydrolase [Kordiimonadaceae bacterium]